MDDAPELGASACEGSRSEPAPAESRSRSSTTAGGGSADASSSSDQDSAMSAGAPSGSRWRDEATSVIRPGSETMTGVPSEVASQTRPAGARPPVSPTSHVQPSRLQV